jgi:hypothetical protein
MHSSVGIAIGRSNHTNGMVFWDPITQGMNVSADCKLDPSTAIGIHFPNVTYDGQQISPMVLHGGKHSAKEPFPPGTAVQVNFDDEHHQGNVSSVPVGTELPNYLVTFPDTFEPMEVPFAQLSALDEPVFHMILANSDEPIVDSIPDLPSWIKDSTQVNINHDGRHRRGALSTTDTGWTFQQRTARGCVTCTLDLADLPVITWKDHISERPLELGWQNSERANHFSAKGLQSRVPGSFSRSMRSDNPDQLIWRDSHRKEAEGLKEQNTCTTISAKEHHEKHSGIQVIPSVCIQTVKKDKIGDPDRAKSCKVALGNHEEQIWEKSEKFAPVLQDESLRTMTSVATQAGQREKQGDCKNAFCQSCLPKDETTILRPPKDVQSAKPVISCCCTRPCTDSDDPPVTGVNRSRRSSSAWASP